MRFEFATATRILFGPGQVDRVPAEAAKMGHRVLLVVGSHPERNEVVQRGLQDQGLTCQPFGVPGEPTIATALEGTELARRGDCDMVVGIGGGSVLDAGKAVAALLTNGGEPVDYLEGIGRGQPLRERSAPFIAIPTTAGTGAEVTRNAVLASTRHGVKVSMRSPLMLPALAVVDPELTYELPPALTASTGLDALTQLLEAFVSNKANPLTDAVCRDGLKRAGRSLLAAYRDGQNHAAREDMAVASLFGGLALANAQLGAVHGLAGPLGGLFPAPHGAVCARLLPYVVDANVRALQARAPTQGTLARFDELARLLTGDDGACTKDGVAWIGATCDELCVPSLSGYGLTETDFPLVIERAARASSMKGNPIELTAQEMTRILAQAL